MTRLRRISGEQSGFEVVQRGRRIAAIWLKDDDGPMIDYVEVDEMHLRRGLATKLYEAAAHEACERFKSPLYSGIYRTALTQAFWVKQVRKGRAVCDAQMPSALTNEQAVNADDSLMGRGGCWRYRLTCPAPKSLARARRRSR